MNKDLFDTTAGAEFVQPETKAIVNPHDYSRFTDDEIIRAVELMVSPEDLTIREVAEAILKALSYTQQEIESHLQSGEYLNEGAYFDFNTTANTKQKSVA